MSGNHTVKIFGWNQGIQTIDLMKLVRARAGIQLGDALALVNRVLDGSVEKLSFSSAQDAESFLREAIKTGAKVRLEGRDD
ncbi:MAG TPA: hypothetical protein VGC79_16650 [Polyangiaceae bacterium]